MNIQEKYEKAVIEKAKKLKIMSERGDTTHERATAYKLLSDLLKKTGLTEKVLEMDTTRKMRVFDVDLKFEALFYNTVEMILDEDTKFYKVPGKRNKRQLECTERQFFEIMYKFGVLHAVAVKDLVKLKKQFEKDVRAIEIAIIIKNDIHRKKQNDGKCAPLTKEEKEIFKRVSDRLDGTEKVNFDKNNLQTGQKRLF